MAPEVAPRSAKEVMPDGTFILDQPVTLPPILDMLIVGGGPFGTAAAFRAKELGLSALVIDYDDLLKRIRDYAKDKLILPDFGGGDRMAFPKGGPLIAQLAFEAIDKDDMCAQWKALYRKHSVPAMVGLEMTGMERDRDVWKVVAWNHNTRTEQALLARHVVLGFGKGVPRRLEVSGDLTGMAFALSDASRYVGKPACVFGGGTSAAEAVIAISAAKAAADDVSSVYWCYRGDKLPRVSKALADVFFDAFMGNGNIRYLPKSDPVAVVGTGADARLSVRTSRLAAPSQPTETTQLEFEREFCLACIGEDIPEKLLASIGVPLVTGGKANRKRIVVSPLLETRQPNIYLAGDLLSPLFLETSDFEADAGAFGEVKRFANIKAALRDGVFIAQVIEQKLQQRRVISVEIEDLEPAAITREPAVPAAPVQADGGAPAGPAQPPAPRPMPTEELSADCVLVSVLQSGVDANEFRLKRSGVTTLGRTAADVTFPEDPSIPERAASIVPSGDGFAVRGEGGDVFLRIGSDRPLEIGPRALVRAGEQWLMITHSGGRVVMKHYDSTGRALERYEIPEGSTIVGRSSPDITIAPDDRSLSRRHLALKRKGTRVQLRDLGGANGTLIKVEGELVVLSDGDLIRIGQQVLRFSDDRRSLRPKPNVTFDTSPRAQAPALADAMRAPAVPPVVQQPPARVAPPPVVAPPPAVAPAPVVSAAKLTDAGLPSVVLKNFDGKEYTFAVAKGQTICEASKANGLEIAKGGCYRGACGLDPVRVVSGSELFNPLSSVERETLEDLCSLEPGPHRLACMARVSGPVVVDFIKQK